MSFSCVSDIIYISHSPVFLTQDLFALTYFIYLFFPV